ncbi:phenylacetate--CoA ligase family protein [Flavimarina sp. Hel_I_48]|uniref:phenylacetate--CoA ligase family protein n=1 Tax=Flavimarina sp. Hel_I_48 TaxID=1392488 RepID=UPI0004DF68D5|nr:phenylacetate--CoA ligase family protein [Flavimarina sp. Hel_I_48]
MKYSIYKKAPYFIQDLLITLYNLKANKARFGGKYKEFKAEFEANRHSSLEQLKSNQSKKYTAFIDYVSKNSEYFNPILKAIPKANKISNLKKLPILTKQELIRNIDTLNTINKEGITSQTGGTTGKSLKVYYTHENIEERFALLDYFRSWYGYELGKKTAWFSGKDILTENDLKKDRFWKTDHYHNVRYYSTFHIKNEYLKYYIENLKKFKPEYISGFPSSIAEIALYGLKNNLDFPENTIKAVFTTSETVTPQIRQNIERFFNTNLYDQYSASEGAPFIFECKNHNLHIEMQSGILEVLDNNDNDAQEGRLIVTSFTSYGTPLLRYDVGDRIKLSQNTCSCGNNNPLVEKILGRIDDFIYSPENGKINLGNISNVLKDIEGVHRMQIIQDELNAIIVKIETNPIIYNKKEEGKLIENIKLRVGRKMQITISEVDTIDVEKSGKFRLVKNSVKHLIG